MPERIEESNSPNLASLGGLFHVRLDDGTSALRGLVVPANLERRNGSALIAPTQGDAALMILRRYCNGSHAGRGRALLVVEHRAEIAHDRKPPK